MNFGQKARDIVQNLNCRIGPSPYDVAWMVRVPSANGDGARWPDLIDWLLRNQRPDGSWGGYIPYYHDRILCTLTAMIALKEQGEGNAIGRAVARGERYVWTNMHFLYHDPIELAGFELILPTLLAQARSLHLDVPTHACGYGQVRAAKLRLLPQELVYSPRTSVAFSLEFLGANGDPDRLQQIVGETGAIACSPATTAYLLMRGSQHPAALRYLEEMQVQPGGVPHFYPFRIFEVAWVLEHLSFGGLCLSEDGLMSPALAEELSSALGRNGASMDPNFGITDGDTTAVTLNVLALSGYDIDSAILQHFEDPEARVFRTFDFERNASVSTNAHALEVLARLPDYPDRQEVWNRIVTMLLAARRYQSYWIDKWHSSPYYATSHVLISLLRADEPLISECTPSIDWLLHMQRKDGSWGYFPTSTLEETAYALLALLHYQQKFNDLDPAILRKGAAHLTRGLAVRQDSAYPDLWIAKSLFAPQDVIHAAIWAATILYEDMYGGVPG